VRLLCVEILFEKVLVLYRCAWEKNEERKLRIHAVKIRKRIKRIVLAEQDSEKSWQRKTHHEFVEDVP
jgi:hypothetical protein